MNLYSFSKIVRWTRNHKKLVLFVITMILIAILSSCLGSGDYGGNHKHLFHLIIILFTETFC